MNNPRRILTASCIFFVITQVAILDYAYGIDWEQWRIKQKTGERTEPSPGPEINPNIQQRGEAKAAERRAEANKQNEQGVAEYKRGNYVEALRLFRLAQSNNPDGAVIRQNVKEAESALAYEKKQQEREKQAQEMRWKEQQEFNRKKQETLALLKGVSGQTKIGASSAKKGEPIDVFSVGNGPLPGGIAKVGGLTEQEWKKAREYQSRIDAFEKKWPLSAEDIVQFDELETKRNALWKKAVSVPGLTGEERAHLRLKLHTSDLYSGMAMSAQSDPIKDRRSVQSKSGIDNGQQSTDPVTINMMADFHTTKATQYIEMKGGFFIEEMLGEKATHTYENFVIVGKIAISAKEGTSKGLAKTGGFLIGKLAGPFSPQASFAIEGGRAYSNIVYQSLNKFMEDGMKAVGVEFDAKKFWHDLKSALTVSQRDVWEFVEFGEKEEKK